MLALRKLGGDIAIHTLSDLPDMRDLQGATVVFVRYVSPGWRDLVNKARDQLSGVVYFMDDDLFDRTSFRGLAWYYQFKLYRMGLRYHAWLRRTGASLWVSTDWLAQKYAAWSPRVLSPHDVDVPPLTRRFFYHGSVSHLDEARWLRPVVAEVLERDPLASFEIIGGWPIKRLYHGLPRVTVVAPMSWDSYLHFCCLPGRHVGLAPLLDSPFNQARSCTKFFDISRCGALGIYAEGRVCGDLVDDGVNGFLLPMVQEQWVETILRLLANAPSVRIS